MNKFKLLDSLIAYTYGSNVCLCSQTEETEVKKIAERKGWAKKLLNNPSLSIKVNKSLGLSVKIQDNWYNVDNIVDKNLFSILSQNTCTNSEFSDKFEVAANNEGSVFLVSESMDEYEEFSNETIRSLNYSVKKKAKKLVPGHRYDSLDETIYCLGEFNCHRNSGNSEWLDGILLQNVYLVSTSIKDCKTISDVLNTKTLGKEVKIIYDKGKRIYVDSGQKLQGTISEISEEQISKLLSTTSDLKVKLDLLSLDNIKISESDLENVVNELIQLGQKNLLLYKNTKYILPDVYEINSTKTLDENLNSLEYLVYRSINDPNTYAGSYYTSLFFNHNIDIRNKFNSVIKNYDPAAETFNSFESYVKYGPDYLKFRVFPLSTLNQRKNTYYRYKKTDPIVTVNEFIGNEFRELSETIQEIANTSICLEGSNVSSYGVINIGTSKSPVEYISITVTLNDIIKHKKGISNLSENLKNEILNSKFQSIQLEIDKGSQVK